MARDPRQHRDPHPQPLRRPPRRSPESRPTGEVPTPRTSMSTLPEDASRSRPQANSPGDAHGRPRRRTASRSGRGERGARVEMPPRCAPDTTPTQKEPRDKTSDNATEVAIGSRSAPVRRVRRCADRRKATQQSAGSQGHPFRRVHRRPGPTRPTSSADATRSRRIFDDLNRFQTTTHFNGRHMVDLAGTAPPARATRSPTTSSSTTAPDD